jgi:hypothetical protein
MIKKSEVELETEARRRYANDGIRIPSGARIYIDDPEGYTWVQAWVRVNPYKKTKKSPQTKTSIRRTRP